VDEKRAFALCHAACGIGQLMHTDVLIVGAGLSGLALARQVLEQGRDVLLVEARARVGGRVICVTEGAAAFDMGPSWFWPGQPRMAKMVAELGLTQFDQYAAGDVIFEDENGTVQRGQGLASMQGSFRLSGGMAALTEALAGSLPQDRLRLNTRVLRLADQGDGIEAQLSTGDRVMAKRVVLALPPRVGATIEMSPPLGHATMEAMQNCATWMAGQAKAVAIYDRPFWREAGLCGDAMSRRGPMVELHDASPADGAPYALFGFIGVPPEHRRDDARLKDAVRVQLLRLFGDVAADPVAVHLKDWAFDPCTATPADSQPLYQHPHYGLRPAMSGLWEDRLILSGTETASAFGGYLEGALEAAEHTAMRLAHDT